MDELDKRVAETMFDSHGKIDLTATPQNYEYVPGDTTIKVNKPVKY